MQDPVIDTNNAKLTYILRARRSAMIFVVVPLFIGLACWAVRIIFIDFNFTVANIWPVLSGMFFLAFPIYLGGLSFIKLLWTLFGREHLAVDRNYIQQKKVLFFWIQNYQFPKERIRDVSPNTQKSSHNPGARNRIFEHLMISRGGLIQFFDGNKYTTIGETLTNKEVKRILSCLKRWGYDMD